MSLPEYAEYKDSGLSWLGKMPAHWQVRRTKFLFDLMKRPVREGDGIVTAFRDGEVTLRSKRREEGFTNALQEIGYQGVRSGDLVIHAMDAFAGAIGISDSDGKSTPVYSVCRPRQSSANSKYYAHILRYMALGGFISSLAKGIRERSTDFRWADAGSLSLPLPTLDEQEAIVSFIDCEAAKIDALIAEQEKLLALLTEKRQATISDAVTRGLNPDVPMKDSDVSWLGQVPAHWNVRRLRFVADIETGSADTADASEDGDYPFFVRSQTIERINQFTHDCEAVMTAGDGAGVGKVFHYFIGKFCAHQRVYVFRNFRDVSGSWFFEYLKALFYRVVLEGTAKSTVDSLRRPIIADFPIVVPDPKEMSEIEQYIVDESSKFDLLVTEAETAIGLLRERRSALISAAVTGKIDVRGLVETKEAA